MVACALRWLSGGRYADIRDWAKISESSFYRIHDLFLDAVINSDNDSLAIEWPDTEAKLRPVALAFQAKSENNVFTKCVGAMDGMLVKITQPKFVANPRCYFSGHYECFGVNIQAVCDAFLRFTYVGTGGPGCTLDIMELDLQKVGKIVAASCALHNYIINKQIESSVPVNETFDIVDDAHSRWTDLGYFESGDPDDDEELVGAYVNQEADLEDGITAELPRYGLRHSIVTYIAEHDLQRPAHNIARNRTWRNGSYYIFIWSI